MSVDWLADARVNGQPATEYNVIKLWMRCLGNELQTQVEVLRSLQGYSMCKHRDVLCFANDAILVHYSRHCEAPRPLQNSSRP
jgi:hypothetical protein